MIMIILIIIVVRREFTKIIFKFRFIYSLFPCSNDDLLKIKSQANMIYR